MGIAQLRAALTRLYAVWTLGRELVAAFDAALQDGWISEVELGALALRLVRMYERITGHTLPVSESTSTRVEVAAEAPRAD